MITTTSMHDVFVSLHHRQQTGHAETLAALTTGMAQDRGFMLTALNHHSMGIVNNDRVQKK